MKKTIVRIISLGCFALPLHIVAQVKISSSVQEALMAAEAKSFALKEKEFSIAKTNLQEKQIKHKRIPTLSASGGYAHFTNDGVLDLAPVSIPNLPIQLFEGTQDFSAKGNVLGAGLTAKSVLFSGLQIPKARQALLTKAQAESLLRDAESEVVAKQVLLSLDNLQVLNQVEILLVESKKRLEVEQERVEKAIANGLAIPYDRDKIVLARLELDAKDKQAAATRNLLMEQLKHLTGLTEEKLHNLVHHFEVIPLLSTSEMQVKNKKEIEALDLFIKAQELNISREKNSILPQVAAFGGLQYARLFDNELKLKSLPLTGGDLNSSINKVELWPNWVVGIGVKWEIFEGLQRKHRITHANMEKDLLEEKRKDTEEKFDLLLSKQKNDWEIQNEMLEIAKQKLLIATRNLERATKQYQQGLLSINDRIGSENDYFGAALGVSQEIAKQRELSIDLLITSGTFTESIEVTP